MARKLYLNLPVKDLPASVAFFTKLGFQFNQQFTDESATCMIVSEAASVMLLTEARFRGFTKKQLASTATHSQAIFALSAESRADVDDFADKALAAGGTPAMAPTDLGFMYLRSFYDLDGHHWEIFYMDEAAMPQ